MSAVVSICHLCTYQISCEKQICGSCVHSILVSFHALGSWAFSNPSQSPMLAHCSVHEWVTAGSERWKVYCGADPDTAHCYLSVSTAMATVLGLRLCIINNERNAWVCFFCMKRTYHPYVYVHQATSRSQNLIFTKSTMINSWSVIPLQVHETVRAQVQQRRPCAVHQVALRASDHPQTGDKHDARPFSSSHQPTQVSTPPPPIWLQQQHVYMTLSILKWLSCPANIDFFCLCKIHFTSIFRQLLFVCCVSQLV